MGEIEDAIKVLRANGFRVCPPDRDPNVLFIKRTLWATGKYGYEARTKKPNSRYNGLETSIAEIDVSKLKWVDIK